MGRIPGKLNFSGKQKPDSLWSQFQLVYQQLARVLNGGIVIVQQDNASGSQTPLQTVAPFTATIQFNGNLDIAYVFFQSPATPNTDFTIIHNLGRVKNGNIIIGKLAACDVYDSPTNTAPFNNTSYIFRCTAASVGIGMIIF